MRSKGKFSLYLHRHLPDAPIACVVLPEKPWKIEAVVRLGLSILVCQFLAITAFAILEFLAARPEESAWIFWSEVAGSVIFSSIALFFLSKPWRLENLEFPLLFGMFGFLGSFVCSALAQSTAGKPGEITVLRAVIGALSLQGSFLLLLPRFLREHQVGFQEAFGFQINSRTALLIGALGAFIFLPVGWGLQLVSSSAMARLGWRPEAQPAVQVLVNANLWQSRAILGLVTIVLAPIAEETFFRGILYPAIKRLGYPRSALWIVSILFGLVHFNFPTFLSLFVMGVMLTRIYEVTGNLLAPIALHCLFNATNFFWLFFGQYLPPWVPFHQ